jgi:hypothetical protein
MTNLIIKYTPINTVVDVTLFQSKWSIINIKDSEITITNTVYKKPILAAKKVSFTKQIDVCQFDNKSKTKNHYKDDMDKYGNAPDPKQQLYEYYVFHISNSGGLHLSKIKFISSLRILQLYYYLMSHLLECYYLLSNNNKCFLYSKRTFIMPNKLLLIKHFIETKTDIIDKVTTIQQYYKEHLLKVA